MSARVFLDTNLWIYFFAKDPPEKWRMVTDVVDNQMPSLMTSTQVLGELYNVLTRKNIFSPLESQSIVSGLANRSLILEIDALKVLQAIEINLRYGYSYWDSLILATALQGKCSILYSEDMQHEQVIEGTLRIINPFL